ncbi:hypothetical protein [Achromobacter insolitus]|uniref:hypothetical protein n=1 Tax=Achromobacter insolitus TaxID=217204 RepID=UPI001042139A|nr:hypothetical protein [Achromobacter insolitus]
MQDPFPRLYLYLPVLSYSEAWIRGGRVPIRLASSYKSDLRQGIMTPDENLIYDSPVPFEALHPAIVVEGDARVTFTNNTYNGRRLPDIKNASRYREDGLILSFSKTASPDVMRRLDKVCCIEVTKPGLLWRRINSQIGRIGRVGACRYTTDHQRDHFLKSVEDQWQDEYRFFWPKTDQPEVWVKIPPVAKLVEF